MTEHTMNEIRVEVERIAEIALHPDPSQHDDLCHVMVKLAQWNLEHHYDPEAEIGLQAIGSAFAAIEAERR